MLVAALTSNQKLKEPAKTTRRATREIASVGQVEAALASQLHVSYISVPTARRATRDIAFVGREEGTLPRFPRKKREKKEKKRRGEKGEPAAAWRARF